MRRTLKGSLLLAMLSLLAHPVPALADLIVVPNASTGAEGVSGLAAPVHASDRVLQTVIAASELTALLPGSLITGLAFRLDELDTTWPPSDRTWNQYNIQLSKSNAAPGALSIVFADNIGADVVTVRSGPLTIPAGAFSDPPGTPNAFGPMITFSTPYLYTGGDLLTTIRHTGHEAFDLIFVDGVSHTNSALIQTIGSFGFATPVHDDLTVGTTSPVYQFQFERLAVPEPAIFTLMGVGGLLLGGYARRARRRRQN